jgi:hypothetical protein
MVLDYEQILELYISLLIGNDFVKFLRPFYFTFTFINDPKDLLLRIIELDNGYDNLYFITCIF